MGSSLPGATALQLPRVERSARDAVCTGSCDLSHRNKHKIRCRADKAAGKLRPIQVQDLWSRLPVAHPTTNKSQNGLPESLAFECHALLKCALSFQCIHPSHRQQTLAWQGLPYSLSRCWRVLSLSALSTILFPPLLWQSQAGSTHPIPWLVVTPAHSPAPLWSFRWLLSQCLGAHEKDS